MSIPERGNPVHWNYYVALDQDLAQVARYIEFTKANYKTYSIELAHLLLAASSEVDVVLKALCNLINPDKQHNNINEYKKTVRTHIPDLIRETCFVPRYGLEITPFSNWNGDSNPLWWRAYNNVKHQRDVHFNQAHLKNTLNSMAALALVVLYYYFTVKTAAEGQLEFKDITKGFVQESTLIRFNEQYYYGRLLLE